MWMNSLELVLPYYNRLSELVVMKVIAQIYYLEIRKTRFIVKFSLYIYRLILFSQLTLFPYFLFPGLDDKFDGYFQGYLAGLTLLKDKTESDLVIQCLNLCQENLDFHGQNEMHSGTVSFLI